MSGVLQPPYMSGGYGSLERPGSLNAAQMQAYPYGAVEYGASYERPGSGHSVPMTQPKSYGSADLPGSYARPGSYNASQMQSHPHGAVDYGGGYERVGSGHVVPMTQPHSYGSGGTANWGSYGRPGSVEAHYLAQPHSSLGSDYAPPPSMGQGHYARPDSMGHAAPMTDLTDPQSYGGGYHSPPRSGALPHGAVPPTAGHYHSPPPSGVLPHGVGPPTGYAGAPPPYSFGVHGGSPPGSTHLQGGSPPGSLHLASPDGSPRAGIPEHAPRRAASDIMHGDPYRAAGADPYRAAGAPGTAPSGIRAPSGSSYPPSRPPPSSGMAAPGGGSSSHVDRGAEVASSHDTSKEMPSFGGPPPAVQHKIPLPNWKNCGPEAYSRPPPEAEKAAVGEARRKMEYETWACHLGQYDYQNDPVYYPRQNRISDAERHMWKEDPFHDWRNDESNMELGGKMKGAQIEVRNQKNAFHRWLPNDEVAKKKSDLKRWSNDPFDGWLRSNLSKDHPEGHNEKLEEAQLQRRLMKLPSFSEKTKRFDGHVEYVNMKEHVRPRSRYGQPALQNDGAVWKDDAFFGWLPGRGPDRSDEHVLHRPLEAARLKRLPSFSAEDKFYGLSGRGIGVLKVNILKAKDLAYSGEHREEKTSLTGRPSPCVRLSLLEDGGQKDEQGSKYTATVENERSPVFDTGFFQFEVMSKKQQLRLTVLDIFLQPKYTLGEIKKPVSDIMSDIKQARNSGRDDGCSYESVSLGRDCGTLTWHAMYIPYEKTTMMVPRVKTDQASLPSGHAPPPALPPGHHGHAGAGDHNPILQVRILKAHNLPNLDTGILGDKTDPYVTASLRSNPDKRSEHRTRTIQNNLDPDWTDREELFILPVDRMDDVLLLEVWNENIMLSNQLVGMMEIPLSQVFEKLAPNTLQVITNDLTNCKGHGAQLSVEIGFLV